LSCYWEDNNEDSSLWGNCRQNKSFSDSSRQKSSALELLQGAVVGERQERALFGGTQQTALPKRTIVISELSLYLVTVVNKNKGPRAKEDSKS